MKNGFTLPKAKVRTAWQGQDTLLVATRVETGRAHRIGLSVHREAPHARPGAVRRQGDLPRRGERWRLWREAGRPSATRTAIASPSSTARSAPSNRRSTSSARTTSRGVAAAQVRRGGAGRRPRDRAPVGAVGPAFAGLPRRIRIRRRRARSGTADAGPRLRAGPARVDRWRRAHADEVLIEHVPQRERRRARGDPRRGRQLDDEDARPSDSTSSDVATADPHGSAAFISVAGFLTPSSVWLADAGRTTVPGEDAAAEVRRVERRRRAVRGDVDGRHEDPVLRRASEGHEARRQSTRRFSTPTAASRSSRRRATPAPLGKLWLEQGGVYVLANIRGGGEFGPAWHEAGLKTKRQIIYDDFAAVAKDSDRAEDHEPARRSASRAARTAGC